MLIHAVWLSLLGWFLPLWWAFTWLRQICASIIWHEAMILSKLALTLYFLVLCPCSRLFRCVLPAGCPHVGVVLNHFCLSILVELLKPFFSLLTSSIYHYTSSLLIPLAPVFVILQDNPLLSVNHDTYYIIFSASEPDIYDWKANKFIHSTFTVVAVHQCTKHYFPTRQQQQQTPLPTHVLCSTTLLVPV